MEKIVFRGKKIPFDITARPYCDTYEEATDLLESGYAELTKKENIRIADSLELMTAFLTKAFGEEKLREIFNGEDPTLLECYELADLMLGAINKQLGKLNKLSNSVKAKLIPFSLAE